MTTIEKYALLIARDVMPDEPENPPDGNYSLDFTAIVTALIAALPILLQLCPQQTKAKIAALRGPNFSQQAVFLKQLRETCDCCGLPRNKFGKVFQYAIARSKMLTEADATAIVEETEDDSNLLI